MTSATATNDVNLERELHCALCGYCTSTPRDVDLGEARGNTERFLPQRFRLWRCPDCRTLHSIAPVDIKDIYRHYPLERRQLDVFARRTLQNLLRRLQRAGLKKTDRILDYGCGNGIFLQFLRERGYHAVVGFDPYVESFAKPIAAGEQFDCVVANDVIEHCDNPRVLLKDCVRLTRPGGLVYVGTADAGGVRDMHQLSHHLMRLHQPFHRVLLTEDGLHRLGRELGLDEVRSWRRSYMDTWRPFGNYRFLDELNASVGHNMDVALSPAATHAVLTNPRVLLYALVGYFFPSAFEPAVALRRPIVPAAASATEVRRCA